MKVFILLPLLSFLFFLLPKKFQSYYNALLTIIVAALSSYFAFEVISSGVTLTETIPFNVWGNQIDLTIDLLSAFFILVINLTVITGALFAIEYMSMYKLKSKTDFSLHFFSFFWLLYSMLMVCMIHNMVAFLVAWEIMSVSSFILVIFENEKPEVIKAGINYLVQMHIGALLLTTAVITVYNETGSFSWSALTTYFSGHNNIGLFLLFFIGFGIKAGFVPFHTWLPHAHPAAPTHISGIMSGVMIKMGIYGILRVLLYAQSDLLTIGIIILVISVISGIAGVGTAIIQHDLKKLLAYHSIENIGIIGIGIGTGMIGVATKNDLLAILGFGGGILHVLNHSLFKSLLFYSTGSVYMNTHTREIDKLGGLIKKMPHTAILFLVASIAICGLPPFNGFVSEFIIYNGFAESMISSTVGLKILMMFSMLSLVVIGGLAIFCFTKAFGIVFLGTPRQIKTEAVKEAKWYTLFPQYLILIAIIIIGVFPGIITGLFFRLAGLYTHSVTIIPANTILNISSISWFALLFIGITVLIYFAKVIFARNKVIEQGPTWGCAYTGNTEKLQYTASSYAENYAHDMDNLLNQKTEYKPIPAEEIFPHKRHYKTHSESLAEEKLFFRIIASMQKFLNRLAFVQTGKTQHYIMYMFVLLIALILLTIFNVI
jgi:formate hydrogenlyase subunit 3/multisubunit Na+/H+ antiporter MnhD subunit